MADRTESSIVIDAEPAAVMAVVADLTAYPQWSDGVKSVEVLTEYEDGRPADARFVLESGPIKDTYELEYDWHDDDEVSWTLTSGSMLKAMDGSYRLSPTGDGRTTVVYQLAVDLSIPMIGMIKRRAEKAIIDTALSGLKERVESA
ncbi:MAG TPA: SRPBCC family protein [Candidatus Nanopelagicales bacterium]|jgi:ribosome-associated toxin RatA of RatAB toxin-antitoxin module|nr:SRPBCC family protein [Candidatus Nanopelagicales bacterium]